MKSNKIIFQGRDGIEFFICWRRTFLISNNIEVLHRHRKFRPYVTSKIKWRLKMLWKEMPWDGRYHEE